MSFDDKHAVFTEAIETGREIEFHCENYHYFLSRDKGQWYLYCEESKNAQYFVSGAELLKSAVLGDRPLSSAWNELVIDYLL